MITNLLFREKDTDKNASYPLGVKPMRKAKRHLIWTKQKTWLKKQRFFIYDKLTDTYHNITTAPMK
jgi:hypothetical protein